MSDFDMFHIENDSADGITKTHQSSFVEATPQPGKVAPSDMSFQIRKLSKEIRKEQRKKFENISFKNAFLGIESRNQSTSFDFPSLVGKLKEEKEHVLKLEPVQLP